MTTNNCHGCKWLDRYKQDGNGYCCHVVRSKSYRDQYVENGRLMPGSCVRNGYEVQSEIDPFYAYTGDPLFEALAEIANERKTGDDCVTTKVDVLLDATGNILWAYREDIWVINFVYIFREQRRPYRSPPGRMFARYRQLWDTVKQAPP